MELIYELDEDEIDVFFEMSNRNIPITKKGLWNLTYLNANEKRIYKTFLEKKESYSLRRIKSY
jgi:hypothetical protein